MNRTTDQQTIDDHAIDAPLEVHLHKGGQRLELRWADRAPTMLDSLTLRLACGCAHCEAARQHDKPLTRDAGVTLESVELAGHTALQLLFSDGHDRGRYPWRYLLELAADGLAASR